MWVPSLSLLRESNGYLLKNMKLELSPEVKERIQRCRDYLDHKIEQQEGPFVWDYYRFRVLVQ